MSKILINTCLVFCLIAVSAFNVLACACCADKGTYLISMSKPDNYKIGLLSEMKFAKNATLFTSDVGVDSSQVKGLPKDYTDENYQAGFDTLNLSGGFIKNNWTLNFTDYKGRKGSLILALPSKMLKYAVDLEPDSEAVHVVLYKEFRFEGLVKGTGFLKQGISPNTKFFLVFRGKGNACDESSNFNYWRVEITGSKANYAFWGKLEQ